MLLSHLETTMRRILALTLLLEIFLFTPAQANPLCLEGCPAGAPSSNKLIERNIYVLSNNGDTKFSDWVAFKVTGNNGPKRSRNWARDPKLLKTETLVPGEYDDGNVTLGIDRGHQAPLGSFKWSNDWRQTNYFSNITPQWSILNQGAWKDLESAVRKLQKSLALMTLT